MLDGFEVNLKDRNNIIKLHWLIHNQLSSPRFGKMIKYSWYKSGYLSEHPGKFENTNDICFTLNEQTCYQDCSQCSEGVGPIIFILTTNKGTCSVITVIDIICNNKENRQNWAL